MCFYSSSTVLLFVLVGSTALVMFRWHYKLAKTRADAVCGYEVEGTEAEHIFISVVLTQSILRVYCRN